MDESTPRVLRCPRCHDSLELARGVHVCRACRGGFVLESVLAEMVAARGDGRAIDYVPCAGESLACPGCGAPTLPTTIEGVPVDRCPRHGIWFDVDELEQAVARAAVPRSTAIARVPTETVVADDVFINVLDLVEPLFGLGRLVGMLIQIVGEIFT
jgi:Zn-finger nucleic acid-binding protein